MIVRVTPQWREPEILAPPWEIVHTVELPPGDFRKFKEDLLQPQPFIMEHASEMYMDDPPGHPSAHKNPAGTDSGS